MRISAARRGRLYSVVGALLVGAGCSNDHAVLELRDHPGGMGGMAGLAGAGGAGGNGGVLTRPPVAGSGGINPDKMVEPPGRSVFTVVHGVVDADMTAWCFARVRNGATTLVGSPVPAGGLAYGQSLAFETLPGIDATSDGVVPYVIAGDLSELAGLDCVKAVALAEQVMGADTGEGGAAGQAGAAGASGQAGAAGVAPTAEGGAPGDAGAAGADVQAEKAAALPPSLRVGALPGLPAGTLAAGYSMIEVAAGCLGAKEFDDEHEYVACGDDYTPEHGSLTAEIAMLSRETADGMLSIQALHASHGSGDMGVSSVPSAVDGGIGITIVDNFAEGALRPRDPRTMLPVESWGANGDTWTVNANVSSVPYASEAWSTIRDRAGIAELDNAHAYTLVAIGPGLTIADQGFWNPFAFALVDNDPVVP
ncbi:MAG TPA: hypothetical protein VMI54_24340 [Polyangiaceae bacterium]|nr:hypothetical protein [Polyangiaceae bacterium]